MDYDLYVSKLVAVIEKDVSFRYENLNKTIKKYVYFFRNHGIPNHPTLPYSIINEKRIFYKNDYVNIYPVDKIIKALQIKFPKYSILLNKEEDGIIIDWN